MWCGGLIWLLGVMFYVGMEDDILAEARNNSESSKKQRIVKEPIKCD